MARLKTRRIETRFDEIDRAMQEEEAKRGRLSFPAGLGVIALVSPVTKQPVKYFDIVTGKFIPAADRLKGSR